MLQNAWRKEFCKSATYGAVKRAAKKPYVGENKRRKVSYECNHCKQLFAEKEVQIDHIEPISTFTTWEEFERKLFCDITNLQVLCKVCHKKKSAVEAGERKENRK